MILTEPMGHEEYTRTEPAIPKIQKKVGELGGIAGSICGSYALRAYLGDLKRSPRDLDYFVETHLKPEELRSMVKEAQYTSRFAVNTGGIQVIPVTAKGTEAIINTFDLTCAQVGFCTTDDVWEFRVHQDIVNYKLGISKQFSINTGGVNALLRAFKYAEKFGARGPEELFRNFFPRMQDVVCKLEPRVGARGVSTKDFYKKLEDIWDNLPASVENYEDSELLQHILSGTRRGSRPTTHYEMLDGSTVEVEGFLAPAVPIAGLEVSWEAPPLVSVGDYRQTFVDRADAYVSTTSN